MHEHELELAAAALDFELTPAERARLDKAIAECSVCAGAAAAYRRQGTLLQALPVVDASPSVRMHVERAAGLRPQRTPWTWALLAAALLGLVLTGVLIAGSRDRQNAIVEVAPTPQPSATPAPSIAPSPDVIALDPPSGELANVGPALPRDSLALVVTDNLRLRSAPFVGDLSVRHKRLLQPDDRLFIVDGPVIAQNYEWYQVKAWRPRQPSVSWPVGWVARAGHDG
jgi:anti-sigma factor RsiW